MPDFYGRSYSSTVVLVALDQTRHLRPFSRSVRKNYFIGVHGSVCVYEHGNGKGYWVSNDFHPVPRRRCQVLLYCGTAAILPGELYGIIVSIKLEKLSVKPEKICVEIEFFLEILRATCALLVERFF
jgi:hypothetical protein